MHEAFSYITSEEQEELTSPKESDQQELTTAASCMGYRSMWRRLRQKYGLNIKRDRVHAFLQKLTPEAVEERARRRFKRSLYTSQGPNDCWHMDGYDKLAPWGIYIHGCIDGYSRKLMWLEALSTNKMPSTVAQLFLDRILEYGGIPYRIRCDLGVENFTAAQMLNYLRQDIQATYMGTSTSNQRIEQHWSVLYQGWTRWWREFFGELQREHLFDGSKADKMLIRFCFLPIIQTEIREKAVEWNAHRVRSNKHSLVPCGVPDMLYSNPRGGARHCQLPITQTLLEDVRHLAAMPSLTGDVHFENTYREHTVNARLPTPRTPQQGKAIYLFLRHQFPTWVD